MQFKCNNVLYSVYEFITYRIIIIGNLIKKKLLKLKTTKLPVVVILLKQREHKMIFTF